MPQKSGNAGRVQDKLHVVKVEPTCGDSIFVTLIGIGCTDVTVDWWASYRRYQFGGKYL